MHKSTSIYDLPATYHKYQIHDGIMGGKQQLSRRIAINATRHEKRCVYGHLPNGVWWQKKTLNMRHTRKMVCLFEGRTPYCTPTPTPKPPTKFVTILHDSCARNVSIVCISCRLAACPWPWAEAGQAASYSAIISNVVCAHQVAMAYAFIIQRYRETSAQWNARQSSLHLLTNFSV